MLSIKKDLLSDLARALEQLSPGAGAKAAFESPKVAAHGDFACTAAMQLAKPLKQNPRQTGRNPARACCCRPPAFERWVDAIEIAGPGFINIRLKPAAKQEIVREVLPAGSAFGTPASRRRAQMMVEFVSANPTGPLHVGHGRQAALGDAICNLYATQGLEVYREFYYNDAGVQIHTLATSTQLRAKGFKPGDAELARAGLQRRLHRRHCRATSWPERPSSPTTASSPPSGDVDDLDVDPPVRRGLPAPRAGPGPAGLRGAV